jgi:hypothetical protein
VGQAYADGVCPDDSRLSRKTIKTPCKKLKKRSFRAQ